MLITSKTKVLGIFGDPVDHSLSPLMHNAAISALGIDMVYLPWRVEPHMLDAALKGVVAMGIKGVNLTIPHKEMAVQQMDSLSDEVKIIGSVNTVVNDDGRLVGYNTDGMGLLRSLKERHSFSPEGKKIVIIGAGGAARGIAAALALGGAKIIIIANRTIKRGADLAEEFSMKIEGTSFSGTSLETGKLKDAFSGSHLLINASTAGMIGEGTLDLPLEELPKEAIVADIVYKPVKTKLLVKAAELGLETEDGLGMLACQGAMAFELWTGYSPPLDLMKETLFEAVK